MLSSCSRFRKALTFASGARAPLIVAAGGALGQHNSRGSPSLPAWIRSRHGSVPLQRAARRSSMAIERPVDEVLAAPLVEQPAEDPLVEAPADDAAASDTVKTPPAMSETARDDGVRALVAAMRDVDVGAADAASLRPRLEALDAAAAGAVAAPQLRAGVDP